MSEPFLAAFDARVHVALIASPGDTADYRDRAEQVIWRWNATRSRETGIVFLPRRYERDAVPLMTEQDGQAVINDQLVREAAVVIGLFHLRLGGRTPRAASGTVEELGEVAKAGGYVHVYFSREPVDPAQIDTRQKKALERFQKNFSGLYGEFYNLGELETKIQTALELDAQKLRALGRGLERAPDLPVNPEAPTSLEPRQPAVRVAPTTASRAIPATVAMAQRVEAIANDYVDKLRAVETPLEDETSAAANRTARLLLGNTDAIARILGGSPGFSEAVTKLPEDRSREQYEQQVTAYGVKVGEWAGEAVEIAETRFGPVFVPELENLSDQWYDGVRLRLTFPQPIRVVVHDDDADHDSLPDPPQRPRPWGPRRAPRPDQLGRDHARLLSSATFRVPPLDLTGIGPNVTIRSSESSVVVTYPECDLHAEDTLDDFIPVVLLVPEGVEQVSVQWSVTTSNQQGKATGVFTLDVTGEPFHALRAFASHYREATSENT